MPRQNKPLQQVENIAEIKGGLTDSVLLAVAILALFAVTGSLLRIPEVGAHPIMYVHMVLAVIFFSLYFGRTIIPVSVRSNMLCICFLVAGIGGLWSFGLNGAGTMLLMGTVFIASLVLSARAATIYALIGAGAISWMLFLATQQRLHFNFESGDYALSPSAWLNNLMAYTLLMTAIIFVSHRFLSYLYKLTHQQQSKISTQSKELESSNAILDAVINALPYGVLWKDNNFKYMGANRTFLTDVNLKSVSQLVGKTDYDVVTKKMSDRFRALDEEVLSTKVPIIDCEEPHTGLDGESIFITANRIPLTAKNGDVLGVLSAYHDITQRKKMESELVEAKKTAERANKAKSEFLANISHEVRTPINGLMGLLDLCLSTQLNSIQKDYLVKASCSAKTLLDLVNDVLDISKIEAGKMQLEAVDFVFDDVLKNAKAQLDALAEKRNIELHFSEPNEPDVTLTGDPTRLLQIVLNLCSNGIKFTDEGSVNVMTEIGLHSTSVDLCIRVKDTGIGIDQDVVPRLFDSFVQEDSSTSRKYGGTGLGLTIVHELAELMNGSISVTSVKGSGSEFVFKVCLPLSSQHIETKQSEPVRVDVKGAKILLVEDNEINQLVAQEMLTQEGLDVTLADDGQIALDTLNKHDFDLVLMDIQMPVMDGCEALTQLRKEQKWLELPVIALTANVLEQDIRRYEELGFTAHLGKPFERKKLLEVISENLKVLR